LGFNPLKLFRPSLYFALKTTRKPGTAGKTERTERTEQQKHATRLEKPKNNKKNNKKLIAKANKQS
jgi:hypothetical protein